MTSGFNSREAERGGYELTASLHKTKSSREGTRGVPDLDLVGQVKYSFSRVLSIAHLSSRGCASRGVLGRRLSTSSMTTTTDTTTTTADARSHKHTALGFLESRIDSRFYNRETSTLVSEVVAA